MLWTMIHDNLFNTHPPFHIEGNFSYAAGVCEMLVQSHMGAIRLLPALPDARADGSAKGMRVRGGVEVDLTWRDGKATTAKVRSTVGGVHVLHAPKGQRIDGPSTIELKAGDTYDVKFK